MATTINFLTIGRGACESKIAHEHSNSSTQRGVCAINRTISYTEKYLETGGVIGVPTAADKSSNLRIRSITCRSGGRQASKQASETTKGSRRWCLGGRTPVSRDRVPTHRAGGSEKHSSTGLRYPTNELGKRNLQHNSSKSQYVNWKSVENSINNNYSLGRSWATLLTAVINALELFVSGTKKCLLKVREKLRKNKIEK